MKPARRLLGLDYDGQPIREPKRAHSCLFAAAGSGKTTSGVMPWLLSTAKVPSHAILVNDPKSGEITAQCIEAFEKTGRKVALIDDANVLAGDPRFAKYKIALNPFSNVVEAFLNAPEELIFATENACQVIIPEPSDGDAKNQYWRDGPRSLIEFCILATLRRNPLSTTPGALMVLLADPDLMVSTARAEAEEADGQLKSLAKEVIELATHNQEHWAQHRAAAVKALRTYSKGSVLNSAGLRANLTHADLIGGKYIAFLVGSQRFTKPMALHYGLHSQGFLDALYSGAGPIDFFLDECTNTPLKSLVSAMTTVRGFGGAFHFIAQSLSEMQRAFGEKETQTILENSVIKQYFGFSSFEEAKRVSEAIGEDQVIQQGFGLSSQNSHYSTNLNSGRERILSPDALMRLPNSEQIMHVKTVGWVRCRKIGQHQIAPWCHGMLADNPLEGPQRPADPLVTV